jgi:hypothetical protein
MYYTGNYSFTFNFGKGLIQTHTQFFTLSILLLAY